VPVINLYDNIAKQFYDMLGKIMFVQRTEYMAHSLKWEQ